jgi:hypothetical protein
MGGVSRVLSLPPHENVSGILKKEEDMPRIVHIAIKVDDLEKATKVLRGRLRLSPNRHGICPWACLKTPNRRKHRSGLDGLRQRRCRRGAAFWPRRIHHWGIEVDDRDSYVAKIKANGGTIISELGGGALKFRARAGTVAEIGGAGRYKTNAEKEPV